MNLLQKSKRQLLSCRKNVIFCVDNLNWWYSRLTSWCSHWRVKCGIHWHGAKGRLGLLNIWIDRKSRSRSHSSCLHRCCLHWSCLYTENISTNIWLSLGLHNRLKSTRTKKVVKRVRLLWLKGNFDLEKLADQTFVTGAWAGIGGGPEGGIS